MPDNHHITTALPVVLCFSGHDPSGGAGLQADIESIAANRAFAATVVTALTTQDTRNIQAIQPNNPQQILQAANMIADDYPISAIKIGLLGGAEQAEAVATFMQQHAELPVILDPVLASGGGKQVASDALIKVIRQHIIPATRLITPNIPEALQLTGTTDVTTAAQQLLALGAQHVLMTGTHADSERVVHRYVSATAQHQYEYERLAGDYHGSGCTLASALAAQIARGIDIETAIRQSLDYTFSTLKNALSLGHGQFIPRRLASYE